MDLLNKLNIYKYIGWVPTVAGRLCFGHILCSNSLRGRCIASARNIDSNYRRYIILYSAVDWKDIRNQKKDGSFHVLLTAEMSLNDDNLIGTIFIYPEQKAITCPEWEVIKEKVFETTRIANNGNDIQAIYKDIKQRLKKYQDKEFYAINFDIDRRGFALLELDREISPNTLDSINEHVLCRQAFYYLKYSLHQHQHHSDDDDSLTTIHEIPGKSREDIAISMINDLKKSLVKMKRELQSSGYYCLHDAKGIASYSKSLITSSLDATLIKSKTYNREMSYMDNLSDSLGNIAENIERKHIKKVSTSNSFRSIFLVIFAFLAPLSIVRRDDIEKVMLAYTNSNPDVTGFKIVVEIIAKFYSNLPASLTLILLIFIVYYYTMKTIDKHGDIKVAEIKLTSFFEGIFFSRRKTTLFLISLSITSTTAIGYGIYNLF